MALELECKIVRKLNVQNGTSARGQWSKQEFIVEYQDGNFPNQVCMNVWGQDKVNDLGRFNVGDKVKVSFNLSSREFNGRWYNDVRAWRIEPVGAEGAAAPAAPAAPRAARAAYQPAAPAGFGPAAAPAPSIDDMPDFGSDDTDLPF